MKLHGEIPCGSGIMVWTKLSVKTDNSKLRPSEVSVLFATNHLDKNDEKFLAKMPYGAGVIVPIRIFFPSKSDNINPQKRESSF